MAGEYLLMAAMLAEIKSRMLLPRPAPEDEEEGADPRAALVRRLQEYEQFKTAAEGIGDMPRVGRDINPVQLPPVNADTRTPPPQPELKELLAAFRDAMERAELFSHHQIEREPLSVRERMTGILASIQETGSADFSSLFPRAEGRLGVVVTFVAVLELVREMLVELVQNEPFGAVALHPAGARDDRQGPDDVVDDNGNG